MSLRAILETIVHVESFRNIDLFYQGLYYLQVSVYNEKHGERYYAHPYVVFTSKVQQEKAMKVKGPDPHNLVPSEIKEENSTFCTKAFLVRYCEEEVEVNEIGHFRTEIDVEPDYLNTEFFLQVDLMFSDLNGVGGPEKCMENVKDLEANINFKQVSTQKFKIQRLSQGLAEFTPITFDDQYYSLAAITINSILLDFRFRVKSFKSLKSDVFSFQERGIMVKQVEETKQAKHAKDDVDLANKEMQPLSTWRPSNVGEFFFADETGQLPSELNMKEVDVIYNDYIRIMSCMHEKIRTWYNNICQRCVDDKNRKEYNIQIETSRLILPGDEEEYKMFEPAKQNQVYKPEEQKRSQEETKQVQNESMYNIEDTNESFSERKHQTNIPSLKNNKNQLNGKSKPFSERVLTLKQKIDVRDAVQVGNQMVIEINMVAGQLLQMWHKLIELIQICPRMVANLYQFDYEEKMRDRWTESIFRTVTPTGHFALPTEENIGEMHKKMAKTKRANQFQQSQDQLAIEDLSIFANQQIHPIIFEECYVNQANKNLVTMTQKSYDLTEAAIVSGNGAEAVQNYLGIHLFVMVHGFQGNALDMRLLKNAISTMHPEAIFLSSSSNEDQTEGDIFEMGQRLANEVKTYIQQYCPASCLARVSFIGHSLGGLIIRASLPHLEEYSDKFYSYMSLSSPHIGYMYNSSKLFDAGMWVLKKWRKSKCLQQLSMSDEKKFEDTALYRLSETKGLLWFKNIALVCSYQDQYAPFDSARIQISKRMQGDDPKGTIYSKMAQNILTGLKANLLYRLDVNFKIMDKNLDSFIGRTAHIQFLECQPLMKMMVFRYREFFQ